MNRLNLNLPNRSQSSRRHLHIARALTAAGAAAVLTMHVAPRTAFAQPTASEIAAATQWFEDGQALARSGRWADALEKFKKVADVKQTAEVLFSLALANSRTGHLVEAEVGFRRAIDLARQAGGKDALVRGAEEELKEVRARTPTITLTMPADAHPTRVVIDGTQVVIAMIGGPIPLNPGQHDIVVEFANGSFRKSTKVSERDASTIPVEVPTGPAVAPLPITAPPPDPSTASTGPAVRLVPAGPAAEDVGSSSGNTTRGWVFLGTGSAAVVGGAALLIAARVAVGNDCSSTCPKSFSASGNLAEQWAGGAILGVGAVAVGLGSYFLVSSGSEAPDAKPGVALVPFATPYGGGASLSGRF
jgi:hypothetical protein